MFHDFFKLKVQTVLRENYLENNNEKQLKQYDPQRMLV